MIKDALQYLTGLSQPNYYKTGAGQNFCDKKLYRVKDEIDNALTCHTLRGVIDFIDSYKNFWIDNNSAIHIDTYSSVKLISNINTDWADRLTYISSYVEQNDCSIENHYLDIEEFIIAIQTLFVQNDNTINIIKALSNVTDVNENQYDDNGVSLNIIKKSGVLIKEAEVLSSTYKLRPFRTYTEIDQPESLYVLRLKKSQDSIKAGLFPVINKLWKREAIESIRQWFIDHLDVDMPIIS